MRAVRYIIERLKGGGWAEFAEKADRLFTIQRRLAELQVRQAAIAVEYTLLCEEGAYIRRGFYQN